MHKTMGMDLRQMSFPSENFAEGEALQTHRCTSFGEAAAMIANDPQNLGITDFFKCFYHGFAEESIIWFAYHDDNNDYENPITFHFDTWGEDKYGVNSLKEAC